MGVPTPPTPAPVSTPGPITRRQQQFELPEGDAQIGALIVLDGVIWRIVGLISSPYSPTMPTGQAAFGGSVQRVDLEEVLRSDDPAAYRQLDAAGGGASGDSAVITAARDAFSSAFGGGFGGGNQQRQHDDQLDRFLADQDQDGGGQFDAITPEMINELSLACANGDQQSCLTLTTLRSARPDLFPDYEGPGGGTDTAGIAAAQDAAAMERLELQEEGALERLMAQLGQQAQTSAEQMSGEMAARLMEALASIGFAAPDIFAGIKDPAQLQEALMRALSSGDVYPTMERQELIAEAAQSPSDVVRLLFLSGGASGAPKHLKGKGAFNVFSVLDQGKRAREGLARQIGAAPRVTFEELVERFMPPLPGAEHGAIVEMRQGDDGVYRAEKGAKVVQGPELFTLGEAGTEFGLLAPGSIIAPKLSKDEPETRDNALRAVIEMALHGKRIPQKNGAKGGRQPSGAQFGASVFGDLGDLKSKEQRGNAIDSLGDIGDLLGGALQRPGRPISDRIRGMKLRYLPFEGVSHGERAKMFKELPMNVQQLFETKELRNVREASYIHKLARHIAIQGRYKGLEGPDLIAYVMEEMGRSSFPSKPKPKAVKRAWLDTLLGGGEGTGISLPQIMEMEPGVREAALKMMGSLVGSDVIASLMGLQEEGRRQAFASGESRLALAR